MSSPALDAPPVGESPRSEPEPSVLSTLWSAILTGTPVVLTVLATFLAGRSSTEMSFAQYRRSAAAEGQARASDQWNFYQAKHIREVLHLNDGERLATEQVPRTVQSQRLAGWVAGLAGQLATFDAEPAKPSPLADALTAARAAISQLDNHLRERLTQPPGVIHGLTLAQRLDMLAAGRYPDLVKGRFSDPLWQSRLLAVRDARLAEHHRTVDTTAIDDADIQAAAGQFTLGRRRSDAQTVAELVSRVESHRLAAAVETAEADADAVEALLKPMERAFAELGEQLNELFAAFQEAHRTALATPQTPPELVAALACWSDSARQAARDYLAAWRRFTTWRYLAESRLNARVAELLEVGVRVYDREAERRMRRCWGFFYGMALAQTAVILSTLALSSPRGRLAIWLLAVLMAAAATAYSAAVHFDLNVPGL